MVDFLVCSAFVIQPVSFVQIPPGDVSVLVSMMEPQPVGAVCFEDATVKVTKTITGPHWLGCNIIHGIP